MNRTFNVPRDTAVFRIGDESPNDLNDRGKVEFSIQRVADQPAIAIRKAAAWYAQHIASMKVGLRGKMPPSVVLLTDDVENRKRAEAEGVPTTSGAYAGYPTPTSTDR